jgi:hypothetical protein
MGFWDVAKRVGKGVATGGFSEVLPYVTNDPGADQEKERRRLLYEQAQKSGAFADRGEAGFGQLGGEASAQRDYLRRLASGQDSVSAEQLRQGLQQNLAAQSSFAAGASPRNSAMAARTAAIQSARLGAGMAGQQAIAGLQERQMAHQGLSNMILQQRGQDMNVALQGRQGANAGYGAYTTPMTPEKSDAEKYGPIVLGALTAAMKSDRRAKKNIRGGDREANAAIKGLRAYVYEYKNERDGKGKQLSPMAQDMERAGLGHAVIDTPEGKMVHGAKAATSALGLVAALGRRVERLEKR